MVTPHYEDEWPPRHDIPTGGRSGFVAVDSRQVHYLEWGHATRPSIVCLHGGGQTAYMFEDLGVFLGASGYHVLAYDLPDHGESEALPVRGFPDGHQLATTVLEMCDEFGIERAVLVGGSLGGITAVTAASRRPELAAGVVLLDIGPRIEPDGVARILTFMTEPDSFGDLEEAAASIAAYLPNRNVTPQNLTRNLRQRSDGRWVWKHGLGAQIRAQGKPDPSRARQGLEEDLRKLTCPVLILRGSKSDILSEDGASEMVAMLPNARLARIAGAGHLAAGDNPDSFVRLVGGFLDEIGW